MSNAAGGQHAAGHRRIEMPARDGPTAKAIASTDRPTANATAINPADGAENKAAPQTALTSAKVPMNSAANSRLHG